MMSVRTRRRVQFFRNLHRNKNRKGKTFRYRHVHVIVVFLEARAVSYWTYALVPIVSLPTLAPAVTGSVPLPPSAGKAGEPSWQHCYAPGHGDSKRRARRSHNVVHSACCACAPALGPPAVCVENFTPVRLSSEKLQAFSRVGVTRFIVLRLAR